MQSIINIIAQELLVPNQSVKAAISLLDDGASVPFIARYRKEKTQGLDDVQLRNLHKRLSYLRELNARKDAISRGIDELGKLSNAIKHAIKHCDSKSELEELYKPFKSKRQSKGQLAIEAGLADLAQLLLTQPHHLPQRQAKAFVKSKSNYDNVSSVLTGASDILSEQFASDVAVVKNLRQQLWQRGDINVKKARKKNPPLSEHILAKFSHYFEHREKLQRAPSHRIMAILRGRDEGALQLNLSIGDNSQPSPCLVTLMRHYNITNSQAPGQQWLREVAETCWKKKIYPSLENELISKVKTQAQFQAIDVFAQNLQDLLMAPPAGAKVTLGLDPGIRTGVKLAIVDANGKLLTTETIYPHPPRNQWQQSVDILASLIKKHKVTLLSIGNGTGSRETEKLVLQCKTSQQLDVANIMVSEAGASVYSASELATEEFPNIDVSLRGAISIARRLQDPLSELIKIDAKAIGVGQYQHDVNQAQLSERLDEVTEDCVNAVGIDLNLASAALLCHVSGLNKTLAKNIVLYRDNNGPFKQRQQLLKVSRLGDKAFEQAAGFLRITNGSQPLDSSGVHPESYQLVSNIAKHCQLSIAQLIRNSDVLQQLDAAIFVTERFGLPTVIDVINELEKPGRDPRPEFSSVSFQEGIESINDLEVGMILDGIVTNVTHFGAFVDIGVHQDGLVHISKMSDKFIKDPREVVKTAQVVKVKVTEIDVLRKRIALSMSDKN